MSYLRLVGTLLFTVFWVMEFEELAAVGSRLLTGFRQGLELLRRPPIEKTTELVEKIIKANETKWVQSYFEARCINTIDVVQNTNKLHTSILGLHDCLSKVKTILDKLESLLEDVTAKLQAALEYLTIGQETKAVEEEIVSKSYYKKGEVSDIVILMGMIYAMVKQDYRMQERIVSALNLKTSSGELESYCLMWPLHPYLNDDILHQAWKLIP
ncbi:hypothetical protein UlMin_041968 [Ulmus minor]